MITRIILLTCIIFLSSCTTCLREGTEEPFNNFSWKTETIAECKCAISEYESTGGVTFLEFDGSGSPNSKDIAELYVYRSLNHVRHDPMFPLTRSCCSIAVDLTSSGGWYVGGIPLFLLLPLTSVCDLIYLPIQQFRTACVPDETIGDALIDLQKARNMGYKSRGECYGMWYPIRHLDSLGYKPGEYLNEKAVADTKTLIHSCFDSDKDAFSRMVSKRILRRVVNGMGINRFMNGWKEDFIKHQIWDGQGSLDDVEMNFLEGDTPDKGFIYFKNDRNKKLEIILEDGIWKLNET